MFAKNLTLALSVALLVSATGCASLKGKKDDTAALEAAKAAQIQADQEKAAADAAAAEAARLSALKGKDGINASGLDNTTNAGADDSATTGNDGTTGKNANAGVTLADMLAVRLVHFDYDRSDLSSEDLQTLQAHAQYLSQTPNAKVLLAGHADERGTREYNMALGERRANAVLAFLNSNGVKASQLDSVSYGKEKPLNDSHDENAWAENRRVEILYQQHAPQ